MKKSISVRVKDDIFYYISVKTKHNLKKTYERTFLFHW